MTQDRYIRMSCLAGRSNPVESSGHIQLWGDLMQIRRVEAQDAGRYVCRASNQLGEQRAETHLSVTSKLNARIQPRVQVRRTQSDLYDASESLLPSRLRGESYILSVMKLCCGETQPRHPCSWREDFARNSKINEKWYPRVLENIIELLSEDGLYIIVSAKITHPITSEKQLIQPKLNPFTKSCSALISASVSENWFKLNNDCVKLCY